MPSAGCSLPGCFVVISAAAAAAATHSVRAGDCAGGGFGMRWGEGVRDVPVEKKVWGWEGGGWMHSLQGKTFCHRNAWYSNWTHVIVCLTSRPMKWLHSCCSIMCVIWNDSFHAVSNHLNRERENTAWPGHSRRSGRRRGSVISCIILRPSYLWRHSLPAHIPRAGVRKVPKKSRLVSSDRQSAIQPHIHRIIELFGAGNRSVTCSCFMLQHTVYCHSLTNLSSFLFFFFLNRSPLSLSDRGRFHPDAELRQTRRSQNVEQ